MSSECIEFLCDASRCQHCADLSCNECYMAIDPLSYDEHVVECLSDGKFVGLEHILTIPGQQHRYNMLVMGTRESTVSIDGEISVRSVENMIAYDKISFDLFHAVSAKVSSNSSGSGDIDRSASVPRGHRLASEQIAPLAISADEENRRTTTEGIKMPREQMIATKKKKKPAVDTKKGQLSTILAAEYATAALGNTINKNRKKNNNQKEKKKPTHRQTTINFMAKRCNSKQISPELKNKTRLQNTAYRRPVVPIANTIAKSVAVKISDGGIFVFTCSRITRLVQDDDFDITVFDKIYMCFCNMVATAFAYSRRMDSPGLCSRFLVSSSINNNNNKKKKKKKYSNNG